MLVGRYKISADTDGSNIICVHKKDEPRFDYQCRRAFYLKHELILGGPVIALELTRKRVYETYSEIMRQFCARNRDVLMNVLSLHKW